MVYRYDTNRQKNEQNWKQGQYRPLCCSIYEYTAGAKINASRNLLKID